MVAVVKGADMEATQARDRSNRFELGNRESIRRDCIIAESTEDILCRDGCDIVLKRQ